ncbi:hypothetical protein [Dyella caseinilytica]|uniref:Uncharacterized protein n=1 Tax=Dyella caseinilytica TaxID=1849581 RepID=A0ABX7GXK8_9GAMM|nr:hypothetical protein [Dyella caseinilytica]QRN55223.1 hypothetical protein ISN74_07805 [Dyella caseinilytica]GGA00209.1 hypothetical protein GCM10011408_21370 [Dyella caseinilytica]
MNVHPHFDDALRAFVGQPAPVDAARTHIQQLEARIAELENKLRFQREATAQFLAKYEELVPSDTDAELPDGSVVTAPESVVHDALLWLRGKYDLEWAHRIDEQTLLHFEVEKAEARIAAWENQQS